MSHTPGPWFMSPIEQDEFGFDYSTIGPFEIVEPGIDHVEDTICSVSGINHPCKANGVLISAAPELLAALKAFKAKWALVLPAIDGAFDIQRVHGMTYRGPTLADEFDLIDAAIAKAEGR